MVAFAMDEKASATILRDAMERHPPPSMYFPELFGSFCVLHGLEEPEEIEEFADQCGLIVKVVKVPKQAA